VARNSAKVIGLPVPLARLLAVGVGIVTFLAVASIISPGSSVATPAQEPRDGGFPLANDQRSSPVTAAAHKPLSLGVLDGREYTVEMWSGPINPTYSIYDADGRAMLLGARSDEVYTTLPDIDIRSMMADVPLDF